MIAGNSASDVAPTFVAWTTAAEAFERKNTVVTVEPLHANGITTDFVDSFDLWMFRQMFHSGHRIRGHL
jgi:hypothetical protein